MTRDGSRTDMSDHEGSEGVPASLCAGGSWPLMDLAAICGPDLQCMPQLGSNNAQDSQAEYGPDSSDG